MLTALVITPLTCSQVIFYGTEQGFAETFGEDDRRQALWSSSYRTDTPLYSAIAKVNALRKREGIGTTPDNMLAGTLAPGRCARAPEMLLLFLFLFLFLLLLLFLWPLL